MSSQFSSNSEGRSHTLFLTTSVLGPPASLRLQASVAKIGTESQRENFATEEGIMRSVIRRVASMTFHSGTGSTVNGTEAVKDIFEQDLKASLTRQFGSKITDVRFAGEISELPDGTLASRSGLVEIKRDNAISVDDLTRTHERFRTIHEESTGLGPVETANRRWADILMNEGPEGFFSNEAASATFPFFEKRMGSQGATEGSTI